MASLFLPENGRPPERVTHPMNVLTHHTRCAFPLMFVFHLEILSFSVSVPLSRSVVVCEDREEPWSWFQHLWWHQRPGEPLQTLWHGTTRPSLPANRSLFDFTSELPWKLLLVAAVFHLSVCVSVCEAAVDLVNFEPLRVCDFNLSFAYIKH